jgi:predicted ATPase
MINISRAAFFGSPLQAEAVAVNSRPFVVGDVATKLIEAALPDYAASAISFQGLDRLAEAADLIEETEERWAAAELHRLRGTLLLATRQRDAAENGFNQALTVARQQGARFWELRAGIDLVRLWLDDGKPTKARELLASSYDWFTEGFDAPVLKQAKALLGALKT